MCKYIKEVLLRNILGGRKVKSRDTFAILHLSDLHIVAHNKEDYMSFGISITGEEHQKTLRGITYVNFDKILCRFLKKFCSIIPIDFEEIMKERG